MRISLGRRDVKLFLIGVAIVLLAFYLGTRQSILFYEYLPHSIPENGILVFYQPSCPKCIEEIPVIQRLVNEGYRVHTIDVYERPDIAALFGVTVTPTIVILPERTKLEGAVSYDDIMRAIKEGVEVKGEGCEVNIEGGGAIACGLT